MLHSLRRRREQSARHVPTARRQHSKGKACEKQRVRVRPLSRRLAAAALPLFCQRANEATVKRPLEATAAAERPSGTPRNQRGRLNIRRSLSSLLTRENRRRARARALTTSREARRRVGNPDGYVGTAPKQPF